ncbi:MAG TPA: PilZ domain-containing protein [Polyangia bacterium]|jgi:c-di-GMP-binding flagellar brake protein YcgR
MSAVERRQYTRLPLDLPLTLVLSGSSDPVRGRLRDISQGGCFVTVDSGIDRDGRITMDFVLLPRSICNATGRVVRDQGQAGFGVEFGATNEALQKFVSRLETASPTERAAVLARVLDPEIHVA